jgi:hypothetical protein
LLTTVVETIEVGSGWIASFGWSSPQDDAVSEKAMTSNAMTQGIFRPDME